MNHSITKLVSLAGWQNTYQIMLMCILAAVFLVSQALSISFLFFNDKPTVAYFDYDSFGYKVSLISGSICEHPFFLTFLPTHSIRYKTGDYCDLTIDLRVSLTRFMATLISPLIFGFLADKLGRMKLIFYSTTGIVAMMGVIYFEFNIITFLSCYFVVTSAFLFIFGACFLLISECLSPLLRPIALCLITFGYFIIDFYYTIHFKILEELDMINLILTVILVLFILIIRSLPESPQFYLIRGKWDYFISTLRDIARKNSRTEEFDETIDYPNCLYKMERVETHLKATDISTDSNKNILYALRLRKVRKLYEQCSKFNYSNMICFIQYESQRKTFFTVSLIWIMFYSFKAVVSEGVFEFYFDKDILNAGGNIVAQIIGILLVTLLMMFCPNRKFPLIIILGSNTALFALHAYLDEVIVLRISSSLLASLMLWLNVYTVEAFPTVLKANILGFVLSLTALFGITLDFIIKSFSIDLTIWISGVSFFVFCFSFLLDNSKELKLKVPELEDEDEED